jgi:hypothetical protein
MIQPVRPLLQAMREKVKLRGMQIAGGWIYAQRIAMSGGWNKFGRTDRSGIKQELRKEGRAIGRRRTARARRVRGEVQQRRALIMPEGIGHVLPIQDVLRSPQHLGAMLGEFVILAPAYSPWPLLKPFLQSEPATGPEKSGGRKGRSGRAEAANIPPVPRRCGRPRP